VGQETLDLGDTQVGERHQMGDGALGHGWGTRESELQKMIAIRSVQTDDNNASATLTCISNSSRTNVIGNSNLHLDEGELRKGVTTLPDCRGSE